MLTVDLLVRYDGDTKAVTYKPIESVLSISILDAIRKDKQAQFSNQGITAAMASVIGGAGTQDILRVIAKNGISTPGLYMLDGETFSSKLIN